MATESSRGPLRSEAIPPLKTNRGRRLTRRSRSPLMRMIRDDGLAVNLGRETRARAARFMQSLASIMRTRNEGIIHSGEMKPKLDLDLADPKGEAVAATQFETFRRALTEMTRYDRYERRASSRRQQAIRTLVAMSILGTPPSKCRPASHRGTGVNLESHKP